MQALQHRFGATGVRFVLVYIAEAHASDEWPVGSKMSTGTQHASLEERMVLHSDDPAHVGRQHGQRIPAAVGGLAVQNTKSQAV